MVIFFMTILTYKPNCRLNYSYKSRTTCTVATPGESSMNISSLNWDLEQHFCQGDFDLLLNRLVAMIRSSSFLSKEVPLAATEVKYQLPNKTDLGRTENTFLLSFSRRATCSRPILSPPSLPHLSPPAFLSLSTSFFFTPSLAPSFPAFWQEHFHLLLLQGFQMSLQEMLVCLSGGSRALWL